MKSKSTVTEEVEAPADVAFGNMSWIDQWARLRVNKSRGRLELLMVYVLQEQQKGHVFDLPATFEQGFVDFCNAPA